MGQLYGVNEYQIDTSDQDAPVDRFEKTSESSDVETKECGNTITRPIRVNSQGK